MHWYERSVKLAARVSRTLSVILKGVSNDRIVTRKVSERELVKLAEAAVILQIPQRIPHVHNRDSALAD